MEKSSAVIKFKCKEVEYKLEVNNYDLESCIQVDYDQECGSSYEDCDHDYNRCMVITRIEKEGFRTFDFCKRNLKCISSDHEIQEDILEQLCECFSSMRFEDYIECEAEGDYYGDILKENADVPATVEKMVECLKVKFTDVTVV